MRRYLVATPTYLHGRPMPRTPDDLKAHQCIVYSRLPQAMNGRSNPNLAATSSRSRLGLVDDADAMEKRVAASRHRDPAGLERGEGVRRGQIETVLPEYSVAALPLHAVYPETQWMSLRARSFLDLLIRRAGQFSTP